MSCSFSGMVPPQKGIRLTPKPVKKVGEIKFNRMKKLFLCLLFLKFSLFSFAQDNNGNSGCMVIMSDDEIEDIGVKHNFFLKESFKFYLLNNDETLFSSLNQVFRNEGMEPLSEEYFREIEEKFSNENIEFSISSTIDTMSNELQRQIFTDMVALVHNSSNYDEILSGLNELKNYTKDNLTCLEKVSTMIAIEVCLNSAKMWLSISQGGEGYFDHYRGTEEAKNLKILCQETFAGTVSPFQNSELYENREVTISDVSFGLSQNIDIESNYFTVLGQQKVGAIICSDAIGAFGGFLRGALPYFLSGGPLNPISNGYLFGCALIGGVVSSASTATTMAIFRR